MTSSLFRPPRLRTHDREGVERHPTWLELFYDLIFVVAIAQLSATLEREISWTNLGSFLLVFVPVWWSWVGQTFYLTRFDTDDVRHRFLSLMQMGLVAALAVVIPRACTDKQALFAIFYWALRMILVIEYGQAGRANPEARPLTSRYALGFGAAAMIWLGSAFVPAPLCYGLWALALVVDIGTPFTATTIHLRFPPHLSHLPERFGLFTIIVLGEAVAAVVHGMGHHDLHIRGFRAGFLGLAIVFALWWIYFDGVKGAEARTLSARHHVRHYQLWIYSHLPLTIAITATAVGIQHVIAAVEENEFHSSDAWLLSLSTGVAMLCMHAIFSSGPGRSGEYTRAEILPHYAVTFATLASGFLGYVVGPTPFILVVAGLAALHVVLTLRRKVRLEQNAE